MKLTKKFRFYLRFILTFVQKQRKIIFLGTVVGILGFWLLPKTDFLFSRKNTQRIGMIGRFTLAELPLEVQHLISAGLTKVSGDGSAAPDLAASWEVKKSGKEYIFSLKDDLYWQDKTPIEAADINYNFSDVAAAPLDEKTIKFELKEPFSPFPIIVSRPVFKKGLLGLGEYRVKSFRRRGEIVERIILNPQDRSQTRLIFRFYPTEEAARTAFKLGEIDVIKDISQPLELEEWPEVKLSDEVKRNRYVAVFFNTQDEWLAEKSLRQSLAYAIKKEWQQRALNPLSPDSWAYNPGVKPYEFDLDNAQTLLKKTEEERETEFKEIELATVSSLLPVAEQIGRDWQELGIETKIRVISFIPDDFQALLVTQSIPPDPDQYTSWHSTQTTNITHYKNPKIDKLLEDGRKTLDKEERKEFYLDFQRFLVEDTPAIFLYHPTLYTLERK